MSEIRKLNELSKNKIKEITDIILEIYYGGILIDEEIKEKYSNLLLSSGNVPKRERLSDREVTNIIHISDIHIRKSTRIYEYNHVFKKLYEDLKIVKEKTPNYLIVITGDLLHDKDEFTASSTDLIVDFLNELSKINDVILIAGNHDINMRNKKDIDPITSIIKDRKPENLYYLQYSGIYEYGNIVFGLSSLVDDKFIKAKYITSNKIKIGLYHGMLNKCKVQKDGIEMFSNLGIKDFKGYNYVLLGDIHLHQYLDVNKRVAYAGSLISQNFSETNDDHGYINWDLINKTSEFKQIKNDYQHKNYEIKEGEIIIENKKYKELTNEELKLIPRCGNIKIIYDDYIELNKYTNILKQYKPEISLTTQFNKLERIDNKMLEKINNLNLKDMIIEYIDNKCDINEKLKNEIVEEILELLSEYEIGNIKTSNWELLQIKFSDMYGYGKNNIINFSKYNNNLIGINAPNSYGKSSILDIITFGLFTSSARGGETIPKDIVNINEEFAECEVLFETNGKLYLINKKVVKRSRNNKLHMELDKFKIYELIEYNSGYYIFNNKHYTKHDISYSNNDKSEKQIKELVGTKEDFIFTCISLQFNNQSLRDMTQSDKKKFLTKIMKLNIFTEIYKIVKEKNTSLKNDEKKLKSLINIDIIYYETIINENDKIISQKNLELEYNNKKLNINNEKIYLLTKELKKLDYNIEIKEEIIYYDLLLIKTDKLNELNKELKIINDKINSLIYINKQTEIINNYKTFIKEKNEKILNFQDKKMSLKYKLKIENTNDIEILEERNVILTNELLDLEKSIQMMNISQSDFEIFKKLCNINDIIKDIREDYINILEDNKDNDIINVLRNSKLKYIEHFNDNTLLKIHEYINKQSELESNNINILNIKYNEELKLEIENIDKELNILGSNNYEPYEILEKELKINDELNNKKNNIIKEINILDNKIKDINNIIKYKDDIIVNNNINKEIQEIKLFNEEIYKNNIKCNNILIDKKCLLHTTIKDLEIYKNNKKLYIQIQKDLDKYKIIENIISNDGIVLYILKKNIPIIEKIINNIIVGYTNKTVKIAIEKENINIDFYQDKKILNCTGGKEQFIIELAFKIAISYIAVLPKANILFIDEGISVLDKSSIDNFNTIVDFLKEHYNNIYLITHIDKVKDLFDKEIIITKRNNRSNINNII
jgi:DNA repair exonuclease SbcCD ATPase subunit